MSRVMRRIDKVKPCAAMAIDQSESPCGNRSWMLVFESSKVDNIVLVLSVAVIMSLSCQTHRALCSLLWNPSCLATVSRSRTPRSWIHAITTRKASNAPTVSFGPEADAVLSKYIKKPSSSSEPARNAAAKTGQSSRAKVIIEDDFEIEEFVDRSTPQPATSAQEKQVESIESGTRPRLKKKAKSAGGESKKQPKSADGSKDAPAKPQKKVEEWQAQKKALKEKFNEGWAPRKKLSPDAMEGIRGLNQQDPVKYSTAVLAQQFKVSPEAIRRILKSKWLSNAGPEKMDERRERFAKRHDKIWDQQAELGLRPPRTKDMPVEHPDQFEHDMERKRILREI